MVEGVLVSISIIIFISAILTILARLVKQPPIIAYILTGIAIGPLFLNLINSNESSSVIQLFAHIGVAFLLFIVGLHLDIRLLKEIGKISIVAGLIEIFVTASIAFCIALLFLPKSYAIYLALALAFSSTVVVVKILSDKKEIDTLHGRIALGILIVEDFVAAIVLMAIPLLNKTLDIIPLVYGIGSGVLLIIGIFLFSNLVLSRFVNFLARSQEVMFLFGVAWALALATLFSYLGFSLEIGALIAGMSLASSKYNLDLGGKIKPLRDFFVVLFFVFFGSQLVGPISLETVKVALVFSSLILVGKPFIVMTLLKLVGYKKRTNFLAGISLSQISEFSLVLILLCFNLGLLSQQVMSIAILIAIITIGVSSYNIYYSHSLFTKLSRFLSIFEGKHKEIKNSKQEYSVFILGYHRIGSKILDSVKSLGYNFVVVDYNPKVVLSLLDKKINALYGDISDKEFLDEIDLEKAKLVISTIPDESSNLAVKEFLDRKNSKTTFLATAEHPETALDLYEKGVDYVILPHYLGGDYAASMIKSFLINKSKYHDAGKRHKTTLSKF